LYHLRNSGFVSLVLRDSKQAGRNGPFADHEGVEVSESVAPLIPNLSRRRGLMTYSSRSLQPLQIPPRFPLNRRKMGVHSLSRRCSCPCREANRHSAHGQTCEKQLQLHG